MLQRIDWAMPWFAPWQELGERAAQKLAEGLTLCGALNSFNNGAVQFVEQARLPAGRAYEQFVFETSQCPTREELHDFFNGLVWLRMPRSKRQLNLIQVAQIAEHGVSGERGPVRDAVTLFDENGAVLHAPEPIHAALAQRDWQRLFVQLRALWRDARLLVFGHALLEKLAAPRKNMTAHVLDMPAPAAEFETLDAWLARQLTAERLAAKPFLPLPVLGIPGWWPGNQNFSFYDDSQVFRLASPRESK
jgi:hypothetical protein